jgi:hypothetical protein
VTRFGCRRRGSNPASCCLAVQGGSGAGRVTWVKSAQAMYDALIRMVDMADRDLMSHRFRLIPRL